MLKILHARLQHYANQELPDVQAGFRKSRRTRNHIANFPWIIQKVREFQENIYLCKQGKALKELGIPDQLTCLLRNLYVGQETTVRALYGATDWFKTEKGVRQSCLLSPVCLIYTLNTS